MSAVGSAPEHWRISRQFGLAVVATLVLQGATVLLWAGRAGERITQLETHAGTAQNMAERLARLEAHMVQTRQSLSRIESKLDGQR